MVLLYNVVMNTVAFHQQLEHRVCLEVLKTTGVDQKTLNYLVVRQSNGLLLQRRLNRELWTRVYGNRVFIYNIKANRAVIELGCIGINAKGESLFSYFVLYTMGGIYNNKVRDNLLDYTERNNIRG